MKKWMEVIRIIVGVALGGDFGLMINCAIHAHSRELKILYILFAVISGLGIVAHTAFFTYYDLQNNKKR